MTNRARCLDCGNIFVVSLTWLDREAAIKEISNKRCLMCGSFRWYFNGQGEVEE